jgi:hypothetical protein
VIAAGTLAEEDLEALDKSAAASGGQAPYYLLISR